jgi:predicted nuclease of predicted toxin-antitoxin system
MRLLLDNNLSPRLVEVLGEAGWDVAHVARLGLRAAADEVVLETARLDARILVSADTDFGALLAASGATSPSMVLVRRVADRRVEDLAALLVANLPVVAQDLSSGCVVVIGEDSLRVRRLPIV